MHWTSMLSTSWASKNWWLWTSSWIYRNVLFCFVQMLVQKFSPWCQSSYTNPLCWQMTPLTRSSALLSSFSMVSWWFVFLAPLNLTPSLSLESKSLIQMAICRGGWIRYESVLSPLFYQHNSYWYTMLGDYLSQCIHTLRRLCNV